MTAAHLDFEAVYAKFFPKVASFLSRVLGSGEAQDVAQAVFIKVSEHLPEVRDQQALSTWIYRIAANAATDTLRSRATHKEQPTDVNDLADHPAPGPCVETKAIHEEMSSCIKTMVDDLPPSYRIVLALSELEGFKNSEIAEMLNLTVDTVKIRLHRARTRLKQKMSVECSLYHDERNELACEKKPQK